MRPAQILFQMHLMTKLYRPGIGKSSFKNGEFRMGSIKPANVCGEPRLRVRGFQIGMALCARLIAGIRQPRCAPMFGVTAGAPWREGLIVVMHGAVVACEASLVGSS